MDAPPPPGPAPSHTGRLILIVVAVAALVLLPVCGLLVVFCGGFFTAIAVPNYVGMEVAAKRAEVPANVDGLKTAELAYEAGFDHFVSAGSRSDAERSLTEDPRPWAGDDGFQTLGWQPDGNVRGAYWVEVRGRSFEVHGIIDADGDGTYAEYVATESTNATMITDSGVF